jgi:hypothetical protein
VTDSRVLRPDTMAARKETKVPGEGSSQKTDILFNSSPRNIDVVKSWTQVFNILQYELVNCPDDSGDDETGPSYQIQKNFQSELHKIAMRPRLIPYNDMICWALENVDISTRTIFNSSKVAVRSFWPEHLQVIYKLSTTPNFIYNANFLVDFEKKECKSCQHTMGNASQWS